MEFLLLGMLGTAVLGAGVFDWFGGNDAEATPEDGTDTTEQQTEIDAPKPNGTPEEDSGVGDEDTSGDDDDTGEPSEPYRPYDSWEPHWYEADIERYDTLPGAEGTDGNDEITVPPDADLGALVDGGAGNDTLSGGDGSYLTGGSGDDVLNSDHEANVGGWEGMIDGGEGNDTINIHTKALVPDYVWGDVSNVHARGGSGADTFHVTYELEENEFINDDGSSFAHENNFDGRYVTIGDFNPAEDSLIIEVERHPSMADRGASVEFEQTEKNGTYTTLLTLTYEATADMPAGTSTLTIFSNAAFGLEHIQLVHI